MKYCENCGGKYKIDGKNFKFVCEYCDGEKPFAQQCKMFALNDSNHSHKVVVYECENCGIGYLYDKDEYYKKCPHCNGDLLEGKAKPIIIDGVSPFVINEQTANELLIKSITKRFFAPNKIKKELKNLGVKKTYFPSKFFYFKTTTNYKAVYERTDGDDVYRVTRSGTLNLEHKIFIECSKAINKRYGNLLESYNPGNVVKFFPECVISAPAEIDVEAIETSTKLAKDKTYSQILTAMRNAHSGTMKNHNETVVYTHERYCGVLLPCYFIEYHYKDKKYINILNAENGKLYGSKPFSVKKLLALIFGILGGIVLFIIFILAISGVF